MKGGSLEGDGRYGCVFKPALQCKKKTGNKKTNIGKLTDPLDAFNELAIAKYLNSIPDSKKYTVFAREESCIPEEYKKQEEQELSECHIIQSGSLDKSIQLFMPWGGIPISKLNIHPSTFSFFVFFEKILEAGAFLVLHKLCHFDISIQNILINSQNTPRFIDFGFSFLSSQLQTSDLKNLYREFTYDHDVESPEITLLLAARKGIPTETSIQGLQREKPAVQRLAVFCGLPTTTWANDLREWSSQSTLFNSHDWLSLFQRYWSGIDSWSLGAVLLVLLETQMQFPQFLNSQEWKEKGYLIQTVLQHICHGNPRKRFDIAEALHLFTNGAHPFFSSTVGSSWISEKKKIRLSLPV
jgi:serine/threonine protein kinase